MKLISERSFNLKYIYKLHHFLTCRPCIACLAPIAPTTIHTVNRPQLAHLRYLYLSLSCLIALLKVTIGSRTRVTIMKRAPFN